MGDGSQLVKEARSSNVGFFFFYSCSHTLTSAVFRRPIKTDLPPHRLAEGTQEAATERRSGMRKSPVMESVSVRERLLLTRDTSRSRPNPGSFSERNVWPLVGGKFGKKKMLNVTN